MTFPVFVHYGVGLWVPEVGGGHWGVAEQTPGRIRADWLTPAQAPIPAPALDGG